MCDRKSSIICPFQLAACLVTVNICTTNFGRLCAQGIHISCKICVSLDRVRALTRKENPKYQFNHIVV